MESKVVVSDRLANMPDHILIHILSFLPIIDAVRTMLVKRFGTLWTFLPILNFDNTKFYKGYDKFFKEYGNSMSLRVNMGFFKFVRNVLLRHQSSKISRFRVHISFSSCPKMDEQIIIRHLDSWIDFAIRKNVEILEFDVCMVVRSGMLYELPSELVSDSVTELKLGSVKMKLQPRIHMGALRILKLIRVGVSDTSFQEIVRGCPLLQELEICNVKILNDLRIGTSNVEKLILDTSDYYCSKLTINCPNLRSFHFTGKVNCIQVQDLSSLVDVTFNLTTKKLEFNEVGRFMNALKPILTAKTVSFSRGFVPVFFYCMLKYLPRLSNNWKRVELSTRWTEKHIPGLCRLLSNSPYMEKLVINLTLGWREFERIESLLDRFGMDDEECCSSSLKRVAIYFTMCSYPTLVSLVKCLLKNASALSELLVCYENDDKSMHKTMLSTGISMCGHVLSSEQWAEFCNTLPTFPKASPHVRVSSPSTGGAKITQGGHF